MNSPGSSNGGKTITVTNGTVKSDGKVAKSSATGGTWPITSYSFKGNNGSTVSVEETVTVTFADNSNSGGGCVTPDTLISLADGTQKRIDQVTYNDELLVWNFYTGKYDTAPAAIIFDHGADDNTVIELSFSDGTKVKVVNLHQFYDSDLRKFVTITKDSVEGYVGHKFAKHNGEKNSFVELIDYTISEEYVEAWGIITSEHYNVLVSDMLSTDFESQDFHLFNYFEIGKNMKYNNAQMNADIAEYGLYTYEDFADYLTYEQFEAFNVQYFKIPVGKGLYTYEGILNLIEQYLN